MSTDLLVLVNWTIDLESIHIEISECGDNAIIWILLYAQPQ